MFIIEYNMSQYFLIIGAMKSGTTSLYDNLIQHPDIYMPDLKEPNYFSEFYSKGIEWYSQYFVNHNDEKIVGESSITYTWPYNFSVAERIYNDLGQETKLIYIVRNPVKRTVSHFFHYIDNLDKDINFALFDKQDRSINEHYIETSKYSNFINDYLKYFKRQNLKIIVFEDYIHDTEKYLKRVYDFLGVDNSFVPPDIKLKTNASKKPKNNFIYNIYYNIAYSGIRQRLYPLISVKYRKRARNLVRGLVFKPNSKEVPDEIIDRLYEEFEPEILKMEDILGRNLDIWRKDVKEQ